MRIASRKVLLRVVLVISALAITYAGSSLYQETFDSWNSQIVDRLFGLRAKIQSNPVSRDPRLIHVDANLNAFRSQHAQVIRNLSTMGAATIAFDTVFAEPVGDEEDLPLIAAAEKAGNVYLGVNFDAGNPPLRASTDVLSAEQQHYLASTKWRVAVDGNPYRFPKATKAVMTYPALALASQGLGHLTIIPDPDGILRRIPLFVKVEDGFYPSISFQIVCHYLGVSPDKIRIRSGRSIILQDVRIEQTDSFRDLIIPIDADGNMILNYTDSPKNIPRYSYSQILQAHETEGRLERLQKDLSDKIVVLSEAVATPFQGRPVSDRNRLSTGMIHAVVIQNILQGSFVRILSWTEILLIEIFLLLVFLYMSIRFSTLAVSIGTFLLSGSVIIIGAAMFVNFNLIMRFVQPLLVLYCALIFVLAASAVERAILLAETERARRFAERELEIGREIQAGFFPDALPSPDGWELVTHFQAARHVSGDFYDAFSIGKQGDIGFVVADVCDKGVGAALFMALFRSLIRVLSGSDGDTSQMGKRNSRFDPARTLQHTIQSVNNYIAITHEADSMFSTIFFGILNPTSGVLSYINGGHEPPMVISSKNIKTYLNPTGPAVGIYPNAVFSVRSIQLDPEDLLLAYTDGVIDAQNKAGEYFAKDRLTKLVLDFNPSAETLIHRIISDINEHKKGQDQFDDITILALRRKAMSG